MGLLGRLVAFAVVAVIAWFAWFVLAMPGPLDASVRTDGIVVLTGGPRRVARGIELVQDKAAKRLLISGVDKAVRPVELAAEYEVPKQLFDCCIDLGREAVDTRSNGEETAAWIKRNRYRSIRLVTAADHMRRAQVELEAQLDDDSVEIVPDGVPVDRPLQPMLREFAKYALRRSATVFGI
jgi:uncharacterized SAM-binding protein YcdF (DUF218 family)